MNKKKTIILILIAGIIFFWGWVAIKLNHWYLNHAIESSNEIQDLQKQIEDLRNAPQPIPVTPKPQIVYRSLPAISTATIISEWQNRVAEVSCYWFDENLKFGGSATIIEDQNYGPVAVTNYHVIDDGRGNPPDSCVVGVYGKGARTTQEFRYATDDHDYAYILLRNATYKTDMGYFDTLPTISVCKAGAAGLGDKVMVLGYPGIGTEQGITVTEGIISGIETEYYVTDAKIDHGNSGGAAVLLKDDCYLGIPTAAIAGSLESLGRILKGNFVIES